MCNCFNNLHDELAEKYRKHDRNARVNLYLTLEAHARPYIKAKVVWYKPEKEIRLSKNGTTLSLPFKFCPLCGEKLPRNYKDRYYSHKNFGVHNNL